MRRGGLLRWTGCVTRFEGIEEVQSRIFGCWRRIHSCGRGGGGRGGKERIGEDGLSKYVSSTPRHTQQDGINTRCWWGLLHPDQARSTLVLSPRSAHMSGGRDHKKCALPHTRCSASHRDGECCEKEGSRRLDLVLPKAGLANVRAGGTASP